jgi:hypothetical protein
VRKWLLAALVLAFPLLTLSVGAQAPVRFASVIVDVWPEYDRPAVLVIDHLTLDPVMTLPAQVTLRVPAQAEVWAVAVVDASGGRINAAYDRQVQGDWAVLSITANSPRIQVEYYAPLVKDGTARHIEYRWAGDPAVDAVSVNFQQPAGATDLVLAPVAQTSTMDKGLTYYQTAPVGLAVGQTYTLTATYQKQNDDLSVAGLPVVPAQPFGQNTLGKTWINGVMNVVMGALGGLLLIGTLAGLVVWQRSRRRTSSRKRHRGVETAGQAADEVVYCSQCGKRTQPGDVFCRSCGARLGRS